MAYSIEYYSLVEGESIFLLKSLTGAEVLLEAGSASAELGKDSSYQQSKAGMVPDG